MAERELDPEHEIKRKIMITHHSVVAGAGRKKEIFCPTQSSRRYLDKLSIEVGDDGVTLLCGVHPVGLKTTVTHGYAGVSSDLHSRSKSCDANVGNAIALSK